MEDENDISLLSVIVTYNHKMFSFAESNSIACYTGNVWRKQNSVLSAQLRKWIVSALQTSYAISKQ